ncbi:MAG: hypothetical protein MZU79_08770 [Anaerotruncus sp.]|nr:hypothetical protein [Anaerotruncus sp.]
MRKGALYAAFLVAVVLRVLALPHGPRLRAGSRTLSVSAGGDSGPMIDSITAVVESQASTFSGASRPRPGCAPMVRRNN